jgi:hypothetical protein
MRQLAHHWAVPLISPGGVFGGK